MKKNPNRANDIRIALIQFLRTDEAKQIFNNAEFKSEKHEMSIGDTIQVTAWCPNTPGNKPETIVQLRNNGKEEFTEFKTTFPI
jgi:hypothetical protein